jgi:hypothetical protein
VLILSALFVGADPAAPAAAQGPDWFTPILPAGTLEFGAAARFSYWTEVYGYRVSDGSVREGVEPWAFDLTDAAADSRLFPGQELLQTALGDAAYDLDLGLSGTIADGGVIRLPFRAAVGVTDWLTLGLTVPFVRRRIRLDQAESVTDATAGVTPTISAPGDVNLFLSEFRGAIQLARVGAEEVCGTQGPSSAECQAARAAVDEADLLFTALSHTFTASPVFALQGSPAAASVLNRVEEIRALLAALGGSFNAPLPIAQTPLSDDYRLAMTGEPVSGIAGYHGEGWLNSYTIGDVEIAADARVLDFVRPGENPDRPDLRVLLTAGGTVRLASGPGDAALDFLDLGSFGLQTDFELRGYGDLQAWGWLGLAASYMYGIRSGGEGTFGWEPPTSIIAVPFARTPMSWKPGNYSSLRIAPRIRLLDGMSLLAEYRRSARGRDEWTTDVVQAPIVEGGEEFPVPDPSYVNVPTDERMSTFGIGLLYSTVAMAGRGEASLPLMLHARWDTSLDGAGGWTPKLSRISAEMRVFFRVWGDS